jgi:hypothetical protein
MPFKANADRRHHIPKQKRKVTNWATETPCVNVSGIWRVACRHVWHQGRFAPAKSPVAFGDP